ncbi:alpha/beta fold hydrolase [Pseudomonas donghuensis]|uniref:alpha/beta fold hydrolase n=1 Tax=Pseudomonas donghuensis TaxID=1163398 RepID=UPI0020C2CBAC|nr:hypothetical protein [Pseudomonas donghuensis]MCP6695839.1 hypothetical protein [Pseudomonas donghuensis]
MTTSPQKILFLPGASGNNQFWKPVAEALETSIAVQHMGWPGFGDSPANPQVTFPEAGHDLGHTHAEAVAQLIDKHLGV